METLFGNRNAFVYGRTFKKEDLEFFERCDRVIRMKETDLPSTTLCHGIPEEIRGNLGTGGRRTLCPAIKREAI